MNILLTPTFDNVAFHTSVLLRLSTFVCSICYTRLLIGMLRQFGFLHCGIVLEHSSPLLLILATVHGREFPCASFVPTLSFQAGDSFICSIAGVIAGETSVSGDAWVQASYQYSYSHIWRNFGFIIAFWIFFMALYLVATELNSFTSSTAEVLVFRRGHVPKYITEADSAKKDEETVEKQTSSSADDTPQEFNSIPPQKDIFTWRDVVYDITIKGEPRRLLDHVSGWVKPGTLTA